MYLIFILLFCIFPLLIQGIEGLNNTKSHLHYSRKVLSCDNNDYSQTSWIIGENAVNGLCNQILGIFSYIPTSLLLNVNLIVGKVYSRNSFESDNANKPHDWINLPFSKLFDLDYFSNFWIKFGLKIIDFNDYKNSCLKTNYHHISIIKDPPFWPVKVSILLDMFKNSLVPTPVPSNTVLRFEEDSSKFTALFNYWKGGLKHKLMLLKVHNSLRPSTELQYIFNEIVKELPSNPIVIHIRLENDYLAYEKLKYKMEYTKAMNHIKNHKCLALHNSNTTITTTEAYSTTTYPTVYLASGLFIGIPVSGEKLLPLNSLYKPSEMQKLRAMQVLERLHTMGFNSIYTRETLIAKVIKKKKELHMKSVDKIPFNTSIFELLPEQGAYIDLLMSRHSTCFIPAHLPSSFSYMSQRMRQFDNGQVLKYTQITEGNFGVSQEFKQWGV